MTNDELLNEVGELMPNPSTIDYKTWSALRAVVELHKPRVHIADCCKDTDNPMDCSESYISCEGCNIYPCETIQAIEKELG